MSRLIWAPPNMHRSVWRNPPQVLLAALTGREIDKWRRTNTWADNIDMIVFTDDDPPAELRSMYFCRDFAPMTGKHAHCVINAPPESLKRLDEIRNGDYVHSDAEPALRYSQAVNAVGACLRGIKCAWIEPEADHCLGALTLAQTIGFVVAYSHRPMIDSVGAMGAGQLGVNVITLGSIQATGVDDA